ncbi:MAG: ATP-binding cassette domain-containing protein, partial [Planctomycetota bacterium]|nr:ATP-binding cassette domain-containing protein [Planctomycetota bacterium]
VVEHEIDVIRHADWIVDVGPLAGEHGGEILYSGPREGLARVEQSHTRRYLFDEHAYQRRTPRTPKAWLRLEGVTRNNLHDLDVDIPLGVMVSVTGVSGSGKSSLVSQVLVELLADQLGHDLEADEDELGDLERKPVETLGGRIAAGMEHVKRLVRVDQKPIGRTPRSNLATYTGLFDTIRKLFAATKGARARHYDAGRFSFNVAKGRCENCEGEGFVFVELLFLPSVYAPCPVCHGARYNAKTLEITYREKNVAEVLGLTVDAASEFFCDAEPALCRALDTLRQVGLGYLRLGQPATELSGGEAQRIKLATELQRIGRGNTLYLLDEPTTGLHPSDVEKLVKQLEGLVDAGNTVLVVEHDMHVVATSDWVIDIGPGAGDEGGKIVAAGPPATVAKAPKSRTATYLARAMS